MGYFKDVTPESVGISSKGIMKFLDRMEQNQIELHSFMVIRHGQCAAKGWWKPYDEKFRHPLYSFSKSLTATAIGFAQQEGICAGDSLLSINGTVMEDIFDYQYQVQNDHVELVLLTKDGEEVSKIIDKDEDDDLGIIFENGLMDQYRSCHN